MMVQKNDLALKKLQRARNKWNEDRMKRLDFINKRLHEKNEARACINSVDEAMPEYYRVFAKKNKVLATRAQLSGLYHPSGTHKNDELLFATVGTGIATYALYK